MSNTTLKGAQAPILEAFHFRHAAKSFDPTRKISDDDFGTIVEAARLSPTSFGLEAWRMVVVQNPALRNELLPIVWGGQGQIPTASHLVVLTVLRGDRLNPQGEHLPAFFRDIRKMPEDRVSWMLSKLQGFFDREFHLETDAKRTEWAARQSYIVLGNMMTTAASLGIDSCAMEGFDRDVLEAKLSGHGGYDQATHGIACLVAFGYRAKDQSPRTRRPLGDQVIGWA